MSAKKTPVALNPPSLPPFGLDTVICGSCTVDVDGNSVRVSLIGPCTAARAAALAYAELHTRTSHIQAIACAPAKAFKLLEACPSDRYFAVQTLPETPTMNLPLHDPGYPACLSKYSSYLSEDFYERRRRW